MPLLRCMRFEHPLRFDRGSRFVFVYVEIRRERLDQLADMEFKQGHDEIKIPGHPGPSVVPQGKRTREHEWDAVRFQSLADDLQYLKLLAHGIHL